MIFYTNCALCFAYKNKYCCHNHACYITTHYVCVIHDDEWGRGWSSTPTASRSAPLYWSSDAKLCLVDVELSLTALTRITWHGGRVARPEPGIRSARCIISGPFWLLGHSAKTFVSYIRIIMHSDVIFIPKCYELCIEHCEAYIQHASFI